MFVIRKAETIRWPIRIELAVDDGQTQKFEFTGIFRRISPEDLEKAVGPRPLLTDAPLSEVLSRNADYFEKILSGWDGVRLDESTPLDFSPESLRGIVTGPDGQAISVAISRAWSEIAAGARVKN